MPSLLTISRHSSAPCALCDVIILPPDRTHWHGRPPLSVTGQGIIALATWIAPVSSHPPEMSLGIETPAVASHRSIARNQPSRGENRSAAELMQ